MSEKYFYENGTVAFAGLYSDRPDLVQRTPWWMISIVFHAAFLFMTTMIVMSEANMEENINFEIDAPKYRKPEYDPTVKRDITKSHRKIESEVLVEDPVITKEELEIDELETDNDMEKEHKAKGRQDAMSTIDIDGKHWFAAMGVGPGASGAYGWRNGGGKKRALIDGGGTPETESVVEASLRWFKRHQAPDGRWSMAHYHRQCKKVPPCEHLELERDYDRWDNCATGFALLCFLGAGHTHRAGRFRQQVANGLSFLNTEQSEGGSFSANNYVHAITTMAVAEAYGMTRSASLKEMGQKAVDIILSRQNEYLGWTYRNPSTRNDTSVTGWQVMALKSAKSAGLKIQNSFEGAKQHFDKVTPEIQGESNPQLTGLCAYTYYTDKNDDGHRNDTCTAISLLCRIFMGQDTKGRMLRAHANKMLQHLPSDYESGDFYQWYYSTLGMFQMGGDYWEQWNKSIKEVLCENQNKGGCEDGSWDPTTDFSCQHGGRLFTTATGCLSLEVYYRYLPVSMLD